MGRKTASIIRAAFLLLLLMMLAACSDDSGDSGSNYPWPDPTPAANLACQDEQYAAIDACYDSECAGCAGIACLFCYSNCVSKSEIVYYTCCSSNGCEMNISGVVATEAGSGLPEVAMSYTSEPVQFTDSRGYYKIPTISGSGTLTPAKAGWCFSPESRSYIFDYKVHNYQDFTALRTCYSISGTIQDASGLPLSGVTVVLQETVNSQLVESEAATNSGGFYGFYSQDNGLYDIIPSIAGVDPVQRSVEIQDADVPDQDFIVY